MKTARNISAKDFIDIRLEMSNHQLIVPGSKLASGSVADKYPVIFEDGKTIIFISDKSKESETRRRYELQVASRFMKFGKKTKE
jgi:Tol biopolymer transport system component